MTEKMEDRRIRRTKRLLKQGFAELMREKDFQEITVRDITDRMDLNRGTFYLHYADTYDLLQKLESDVLDDVQRMIDEHSSEAGTGSLQPVFEPVLDFIGKVQKLIYENGVSLIHRCFSANVAEEKLAYILSFITYGLIGLIKQWFDSNMSLDKHEVVKMADFMVTAAAERLIK